MSNRKGLIQTCDNNVKITFSKPLKDCQYAHAKVIINDSIEKEIVVSNNKKTLVFRAAKASGVKIKKIHVIIDDNKIWNRRYNV